MKRTTLIPRVLSAALLAVSGSSADTPGTGGEPVGETDDTALRRAARAQAHGLAVIYCIGETLAQRDGGETSHA